VPGYCRLLVITATPLQHVVIFWLNEVIPYMVEDIVQDGVYFIRDFPNHKMLNYLKVAK
jgi:hypothetical protein